MGWDLFAYGKLPYLGSWDVNFPGIVYIHWLSIALLGRSDLAFRMLDLLAEVAACLLFYKLLTRWIPPAVALTASAIYALLYVSLAWPAAGQRDAFAVLFLVAGLELFFQALERRSVRSVALCSIFSGFLLAFCSIIRPTYGLWQVSLVLAYIISQRKIDRPIRGFVIGSIAGLVALFLPYALAQNGLRDLYRFAILFNLDVYSKFKQPASVFFSAPQITGRLAAVFSLAGLAAMVLLHFRISSLAPRNVSSFLLLLYPLLLLSSLGSLFIMHSFFLYQYLPLLLLLSPLMAFAVFSPRILPSRLSAVPLEVLLMLYLAYSLYPRNFVHDYRNALKSGGPALDYIYNLIDNDSLNGHAAEAQAVDYLNKADSEGRPIEVVCYNHPYLRVKAGLESATRFSEILPLTTPARGDTFTSYQDEWRREFIVRLSTIRPKFIVFVKIAAGLLTRESPFDLANSIPGFPSLLAEDYHRDTTIRGFLFYRANTKRRPAGTI